MTVEQQRGSRAERVEIRAASPGDAAAVLAIYAPIVRATTISFEEEPPSVSEMGARMAASHLWLVAEEASQVIGYAYAAPFHARAGYRWSVEASIYLAEGARGHGTGRALLDALLEGLRPMGFVNAFAGIALPNEASVRLFTSFGFEKAAHYRNVGSKFGTWLDVAWYQLKLAEPIVPPPHLNLP